MNIVYSDALLLTSTLSNFDFLISYKSVFYTFCVTDLGDASEKWRNFAACLYAKRRTGQAQQALLS